MNENMHTESSTAESVRDTEYERLLEQERLIMEASEEIARLAVELEIPRQELARRLGKSKGFISQVLSGERNMTLRTLSDLAFALNLRVRLELHPLTEPASDTASQSELSLENEAGDVRFVQFGSLNACPRSPEAAVEGYVLALKSQLSNGANTQNRSPMPSHEVRMHTRNLAERQRARRTSRAYQAAL